MADQDREEEEEARVTLQKRENAFNRRIATFSILNNFHIDIQSFLNEAFEIYKLEMIHAIETHNLVKTIPILCAEFEQKSLNMNNEDNETGSEIEQTIKETLYFTTANVVMSMTSNIQEIYRTQIVDVLSESVQDTAVRGSGFALSRIKSLDIQVCMFEPLKASSFIELPNDLKNKKCIVNVMNNDNMCFKWAVLSAIHPMKKNPNRVALYKKGWMVIS